MEELKKKRGRPRKSPLNEPTPTKQFPITFKCTSELEMDLYEYLVSQLNRGVYIKETLIKRMFEECPDLAIKHGRRIVAPTKISEPVTEYRVDPPEEIEVVDPEPSKVVEYEPPKVKRGAKSMGAFL